MYVYGMVLLGGGAFRGGEFRLGVGFGVSIFMGALILPRTEPK